MTLPISLVKEEFLDFDHFRDVLLGWDVDVTQVSAGPLKFVWEQVAYDGELTIAHLKDNRRLIPRTVIEEGRNSFVVIFTPIIFCGLEASEGSLLVFGPGREYRSILPEGFESLEFCASTDYLTSMGLTIGDESFNDLGPERSILGLSADQVSKFRLVSQTLDSLFAHQCDPDNQQLWANAARERGISLIVSALQQHDRQPVETRSSKLSEWLLMERALDHIDELGSHGESIAAICESVGCSNRALQYAFKNTLGMTPLQYLLARRLQHARHDLLTMHRNQLNVTEIAVKNEFFHFGRFSQYYQDLFGERPSETLKQVRHQSLRLH
ncbi:MAG: helix-turn-helix domain-containing protein [Anderseniella sp.]